jgi:hypothetical protein
VLSTTLRSEEEVDSRQFKVQSRQTQNQSNTALLRFAAAVLLIVVYLPDRAGPTTLIRDTFDFQLSTVDFFFSQHSPGGIGLPCGHVFGWPRNVQMR